MNEHEYERDDVERARRGDEAAWLALVRRHEEPVFRLAYLILRDDGEAGDVAQETFVRAFHKLDTYDAARPLRPWLLRIARNLAYNRQRSLQRYWAAAQRWFTAQPAAAPDPVAGVAAEHEAETIRQAVRRLRRSDQEVIYLRYFLELSVDESAAALEVAPGTVKSRLSRAMGRLRTLVETEFPGLVKEYADEH